MPIWPLHGRDTSITVTAESPEEALLTASPHLWGFPFTRTPGVITLGCWSVAVPFDG